MVKWGVLGTANVASWGCIPGMLKANNCELYAIAGRSAEKVEQYKQKFGFEVGYVGYDKLLEDPAVQAVYIPLPNHIHKEWVIKALKAGKNVLCEKPMALNAQESEEMYAAAKENNVILMEAYAYLHGQFMESLKKDIESGVIGDIVYIDTAFVTQGYKEDFRLHKEFGGGMIYDLGCYCTTMMLSLIDSEVEYAKACAEMTDLGVDSFVGGLIKFKNGARASFNAGMILGENTNSRFDRLFIHGTKGNIRSEYEYNQSGETSYRIIKDGETLVKVIPTDNNYQLEVEQLGRCIENGEKPHISPEFSIKNAKLLDALLDEVGFWK
ncbi:MAG: Gfo/Idh/MocA family oxidoreductase [Lachnospiraceae bacterium]|nr:Gfo/Idh/MocA family oxidoreductase [Lachnospiraceae bacterium]